ncbi:TIM barrel protein [Shigella flexneri]|uniref:TIM barrel protein n=1 Tax=Shigella flexneri TaxID=623 RepID=UPI000DA456E8|nr:TIM barrel protein [Shigella flexneri]SRP35324.1 transient receptor potential locus [Shigella flexneri]
MKIGTQNQAFFPENIRERFRYIKEMGFDGFEIDGKLLVNNIEEDNLAQALHDNRDLLGHVHIADNHRYQPGSGTLDFHALFEQLRADNYQGYVVYEGRIRAEDPAQAYRDSLAWLRTC